MLPLAAQRGDRTGDDPQIAAKLSLELPPVPVLTPEQARDRFQLEPGFRIDLVAAEPLVHDPVAMAFDPQGNLWVAEMAGYNADIVQVMPELAGTVKSWPKGKIVKLEDTDGDGRMDRRTVFLDDLESPRAFAILRDGVIVADPPYVWFVRDTDGDGKGDTKELIADNYGRKVDTEAAANGLLWGRDNWIHNISYGADFRYRGGKWGKASIALKGQFGVSQDDFGRLYFNRNSDQLQADLFGPMYGPRNPHVNNPPWANYLVAKDQRVWPSHPTPGVNRGYRSNFLREDGTLQEFTAACSPLVYRGVNFPRSYLNNVFVCEPSANLIKRNLVTEKDGILTARNAYEGREFLTSTDERFRPVAIAHTPQGDLYIADLYRGILQEVNFMTSYLRDQVTRRGLEQPSVGLGRIWRLRFIAGTVEQKRPALEKMASAGLVQLLAHPNGWQRDTAQQVLVERGDRGATGPLEELFRQAPEAVTRVYALWTLDGLGVLSPTLLKTALADPEPKVRVAAVRLHESLLATADADRVLALLAPLIQDPAPEVTVQLALTLGAARTPLARKLMHELLATPAGHPFIPQALASGLRDNELEFFAELAKTFPAADPKPALKTMIRVLAIAIVREGRPGKIERLLASISDTGGLPEWARLEVVESFESLTKRPVYRAAPDRLLHTPGLQAVAASNTPAVRASAEKLVVALTKLEAQHAMTTPAVKLNEAEIKRFEEGKVIFTLCASCHQPQGTGLIGVAPSLVDSPWVRGRPELLISILLHGKEGTPGFPSGMPPVAMLPDAQIAAVVTYVRNEWGLHAGAVTAEQVAAIRKANASRVRAWTDGSLESEAVRLAAPAK